MKYLFVVSIIVFAISLLVVVPALADSPLPTPTAEFSFPIEPPVLPDLENLPENPADLLPTLELLILFAVGWAAKHLTDWAKLLPWISNQQNENVRKQLIRVHAAIAALILAAIMPWAQLGVDFLQTSGLWQVVIYFLPVLLAQGVAHRSDKMAQGIAKALLKRA